MARTRRRRSHTCRSVRSWTCRRPRSTGARPMSGPIDSSRMSGLLVRSSACTVPCARPTGTGGCRPRWSARAGARAVTVSEDPAAAGPSRERSGCSASNQVGRFEHLANKGPSAVSRQPGRTAVGAIAYPSAPRIGHRDAYTLPSRYALSTLCGYRGGERAPKMRAVVPEPAWEPIKRGLS